MANRLCPYIARQFESTESLSVDNDYATGNSSSETTNVVVPPPVIEEPEYTPPAQTETIMVWIPTRGGKKASRSVKLLEYD